MPYIGQVPVTGENNNFKILDDITSYTETFNGSSSGVVSVADDTLTFLSHRFITGQRITYSTTGTAIGGLVTATAYFVIKNDQNTIKLATTYANAINNVAINLTALGTGTTHTLIVAFDSINTKFKATFDNGTKALITRAGQLQISINGVIQQPQDTTSPSNGFGIDLDGVIIFSTAPASTDIFWGNVFANNFATFDIADNTVDSFTGNGSQVDFTLSKIPANNQNILVTIDGVVQYPSDSTTVRAYSLSENVLTFVGAPGNATAIQVRHIGFAGATSSSVTGFYGRTGNVVLTSADNVSVGGIVASGIITATSFSGTATSTTNIPNLTGAITSNNTTTSLGFFSSANLATALTDETGSGSAVFATSPTLVTPVLGAASATSINSSGIVTASQLSTGASGTGVNITTNTISGPATLTIDPAAVGDNTGLVVIKGDLQIDGTTTTVNSTIVTVDDKNIVLGSGAINDSAADGSGITIESGNGNKTFQFEDTGDNLGSSENLNVASGKVYKVNNTSVLSSTTLGSGVVNSSLTSVGTLGQLQVTGVSTFTNGPILVGTATSTGTASQPLQVTGGAYVSGNLGIGTTNPGATLNVVPTSTSIAGLFSGTTSSDMVRITQEGTGNALVVEDSTNPDATPFVVTAAGSVGIGTIAPASTLDVYGSFSVGKTSSPYRYCSISNLGQIVSNIANNGNESNLVLDNVGDLTSTDGHGSNILFRFSDNSSATAINSGQISVTKTQQWTSTASTRNSRLSIALASGGTVSDRILISSAGGNAQIVCYKRSSSASEDSQTANHQFLFLEPDGNAPGYYRRSIISEYKGINQYSYWAIRYDGASYDYTGSLKCRITWSTSHASGAGFAEFSLAVRSGDSDGGPAPAGNVIQYGAVQYSGGWYYGWTANPDFDVYYAGFNENKQFLVLRLSGYMSHNSGTYDGGVHETVDLESWGYAFQGVYRIGTSAPAGFTLNAVTKTILT